jgi:membrane-associated phospholipid phosphatase
MAQIIFRLSFPSQCFHFLCFACLLPLSIPAQEYRFNPTREWIIGGTGLIHAGINLPLARSTQPLTQVPPAPRHFHSYTYRPQAARISDGLIGVGAILLPVTLYSALDGTARGQALAVCAQSMVMNLNITQTLKHSVRRPRPYFYDPQTPAALLGHKDARLSFPSGHSSVAFCLATSLSLALRTYDVNLSTRRRITAGAFALAGTTAILRVVAAKHYPGDILAGAALGTGIALLNHYLHAPR